MFPQFRTQEPISTLLVEDVVAPTLRFERHLEVTPQGEYWWTLLYDEDGSIIEIQGSPGIVYDPKENSLSFPDHPVVPQSDAYFE